MSSEWIETTLGELVNFKNGKTSPDRNDSASIPVYGSNGIIGYSKVANAPEKCLTIGRVGSYCGSVYHSYEQCWVTDNAILGLPKNEGESEFWYFLLVKLDLNNYRSGSGQPLLNQATLNSISIRVPELAEDRASIGKRLMMFDNKIELNRQINQTLEQIAQAIFKSWFVDFEPVKAKIEAKQALTPALSQGERELIVERAAIRAISGLTDGQLDQLDKDKLKQLTATATLFPDELEESELGEIPKGWEVKQLDKIADYLNGLALQKFPAESNEKSLPVIKIAQLKKGDTVGADRASSNIKTDYIIDNGDVIFSWSGSLFIDIWCGGKGALNQHLFKVTSKEYPKWFYLHWTNFHLAEFQRIAADKAVTMGHIKRGHLSAALCLLPDSSLLASLGEYIENLIDLSVERRLENTTLVKLRDSLLPKLLSGEITIGEVECKMEAMA